MPSSDISSSTQSPVGAPAIPNPTANEGSAPVRFLRFFRSHPVVCLFLLTPGLVEYTSGSSSFVFLVSNPAWFFLALGINAAMYTSGALLIREALIAWNKGWPTILALGSAYAIMEEGIADQTIFDPHTSPIGAAGTYGHFLGVNWLWFPDILVIHILMSLLIPILLLSYALPATRGRRLLTDRQVPWVVALISADTAFLTILAVRTLHTWYGFPMLGIAIASIALLCVAGRFLPKDMSIRRPGPTAGSRLQFFLVGCFAYPSLVVIALVGAGQSVPPVVVFLVEIGAVGMFSTWVLRHVGTAGYERNMVAFAAGLLSFGIFLGLVLEFPVEIVAIADVAVIYFLYRLDHAFATGTAAIVPPSNSVEAAPA